MSQELFDKGIKKALENMDIAFNADHWQQMEMLLHNLPVGDEGAIDAHFDAMVNDKIGRLEVPINHAAWAGIEADLTNAEAADIEFDTAITDKLANPTVGAAALNWNSIEQALDLEEIADAKFDEEIYASLQNLHASPPTNYWQRLVNKLNADFTLREKLYRYKLIEATLMILLLLNFYQYLPNTTIFPSTSGKQEQQVIKAAKQTATPAKESIDKDIPTAIVPATKATNNIPKKPLIAKQATVSEENVQNAQFVGLDLVENSATTIARNYSRTQPIATLSAVFDKISGLSISVSEMNQHLTLYTETGSSIIHTVPSLKPNFVESQYITPLYFKGKYTKIPARLRLGLVANLASTNAYVSGGEILDISAFTDKGFGYGIGGSLGFKYGRWEIETGLMYAAKQYDPNIVDTPKPNAKRTHFQTVHLQTMHIPINLRYNYAVLGKGKWHFYGQLGTALNVILRAEYDLAEVSSIPRSKVNDVTTSRINLIDFNNGVLAGDGFKENRFLSINMGAGVERYITPRWSLFVQPDFHFHFSGNRIGPTEDKINTLAISFGARKSL